MVKVIVQSLPDYTHAQLLTAAGHSLIADEAAEDGGDGLGPDPYELLLWALGACTSMTLQLHARRKGYPLEEVAVEVEHERRYPDDCRDCDDPSKKVEVVHRRMVLRGPLSVEQRDDLLRVAQKCPVHKTLAALPETRDTVEVVA
jgi:putative redox protein